jgi:cysteinyl-tRNA synthetase
MKFYNTLTGQLEEFQPIVPNKVSMYVCGPTVYSHIHVGNARPLLVFDVLRRYLMNQKYDVHYVMNITDVNDKITIQAHNEKMTEQEIAQKYTKSFLDDYTALQCLPPSKWVKVSESVDSIATYIQRLIDKGFAYEVDGDVYFRVHRIEEYGRLSGQKKDDLIAGARVEVNAKKESPLDFVLWKHSELPESFSSSFGMGRPGWHTECSCMIEDEFQSLIDIHGGGADLRFPHHENEMAQSLALNNHPLANLWMHNARIDFGEEKMSKSLGNVILLKDLLHDYDANALRLYLLSTSYRTPMAFRFEQMEFYKSEWEKINRTMAQLHVELDVYQAFNQELDDTYVSHIQANLAQDLNTANVISDVYAMVKDANKAVRAKDQGDMARMYNTLLYYADLLGLRFELPRLSADDRSMYFNWVDARDSKDYERADVLRQKLTQRGILL